MKNINYFLSSLLAITLATTAIAQENSKGQSASQSQPRLRITHPKQVANNSAPIQVIPPTVPANGGQQFYQNQPRITLDNSTQAGRTATKSASDYQAPIHQGSSSTTKDGIDYKSHARVGLDGRTDSKVGAQMDSKGDKFIGGSASAGGGLYADAGVSQSGKIGNVKVTNRASTSASLATEGEARAGISDKGATVGVKGFSGGRAGATIGSDIGPVGYGTTGEVWSGLGVDAGVNAGFKDGKLRLGGSAGAALGVGGKVGVEVEVDVKAIGEGVVQGAETVGRGVVAGTEKVGEWGQDVGRTAETVGRDVGRHVDGFGRDVSNFGRNAGQTIGNTAQSVGRDVGRHVDGFGRDVSNFGRNAGQTIGNTAQTVGQDVGRHVDGFGRDVSNFGRNAGQTIGNTAQSVGRDVGNFGRNAGQSISQGAQSVGRDVGNAAKSVGRDVGKAAQSVGRDVGKAAQGVGRGVENAARDVGGAIGGLFGGKK